MADQTVSAKKIKIRIHCIVDTVLYLQCTMYSRIAVYQKIPVRVSVVYEYPRVRVSVVRLYVWFT